jgi:uncharacterized protein YjbI with pentapeptide repeats
MAQNFSNQNLQGRSFKGQDLTGADFSNAKIHGTDFSEAILTKTNFSNVRGGLPQHWVIGIGLILLLASIVLGFVIGVFGIFAGILLSPHYIAGYSFIPTILTLIIFLILSFVTIRYGLTITLAIFLALILMLLIPGTFLGVEVFRGTLAVAGASAFAVISCILGGFTFTVAGIFVAGIFRPIWGVIISAIVTFAVAIFIIYAVTVAASTESSELLFNMASGAEIVVKAAADAKLLANSGAVLILTLSFYIAKQALAKNEKYALIRKFSLFLTTIGGTNFYKANLTDANFAHSKLKNTNLTKAILIRTYWLKAKLDFARVSESYRVGEIDRLNYLSLPEVQQLLVSGVGENKNFDRQDFRDINLREFNLKNASFIDTDFCQADLRCANLDNAILVRVNLERADLRDACLTRSCVQDCNITKETKLNSIKCDFFFLKWSDGTKCDQMPPRGKLKKDGFSLFQNYLLDTIDIYHNRDINPRLALTILNKMSKDYNEPLKIVAVGRKGDKVFIKVKLSKNTEPESFKEDYYSRYEGLEIASVNSHQLPLVDELIENELAEISSEQTDEIPPIIVINETIIQKLTIEGEVSVETIKSYNITQTGSSNVFIEGKNGQVQNTFNQSEHKQPLAEAAEEIQKLLKQLEQTNPTATDLDKIAYVNEETTPGFKRRVAGAFQAGSEAAIEEFLGNPYINLVKAIIKGWLKPE